MRHVAPVEFGQAYKLCMAGPFRILVVGDNEFVTPLARSLTADLDAALATLDLDQEEVSEPPHHDAVVVQWLPGRTSFDLLRQVSEGAESSRPPTIAVVTREERLPVDLIVDDLADDVAYYAPGIEACLTARVLVSVIRRRRGGSVNGRVWNISDRLSVLADSPMATLNGRALELTVSEWRLLICLTRASGAIVPAAELCRASGISPSATHANLRNEISRLRRKLKPHSDYIQTVRNSGYRLLFLPTAPVAQLRVRNSVAVSKGRSLRRS